MKFINYCFSILIVKQYHEFIYYILWSTIRLFIFYFAVFDGNIWTWIKMDSRGGRRHSRYKILFLYVGVCITIYTKQIYSCSIVFKLSAGPLWDKPQKHKNLYIKARITLLSFLSTNPLCFYEKKNRECDIYYSLVKYCRERTAVQNLYWNHNRHKEKTLFCW